MEPVGILGAVAIVVVGVAISRLVARSMNRGIVYGGEPDPRLLRDSASQLDLTHMPRDQGLMCTGVYHEAHVSVEAKWWQGDRARARGFSAWQTVSYRTVSWQVQTTMRAAFGVPMPVGMHLRKQTTFGAFADALVSGGEIVVNDAKFDAAFIIHGNDLAEIDRVLTEGARGVLLHLARVGDVWVDEQSIRLILPKYVRQPIELANLLDALTEAVRQMRGGAAPAIDSPRPAVPVAMVQHRRSLASELRKTQAAGGHLTMPGRDAIAGLSGLMVSFEVDVEHVVPHQTSSGRTDGVMVSGVLVSGTGRVDVNVTGESALAIVDLRPGDRLRCDGTIVRYDAYRDRTELDTDKAELAGRGTAPFVVSAVGGKVDLALVSDRIDEILPVLYTGREAREKMVAALKGRVYLLKGTVRDALPTPSTRAGTAAYQGGLTVVLAHPAAPRPITVRFPADRTAWLSELDIGAAIEVDGAFVEWDELGDYAVFEERGA